MSGKIILLLVVLCVSYASAGLKSVEEVKQSITVVAADDSHLRAYQANWWPTVNPRIIQLLGLAIQLTDNGTSAEVDALEFVLSTYLQTALSFAYFHAEGDLPVGNETEWTNVDAAAFAAALRLFYLFEYNNVDGVPGFQNGTDQITGAYDLSHYLLQWKPLQIDSSDITVNGTDYNLFIVTAETADEVFLLRFVAIGHPVEVEGVKITPDSIKVDLQIKWFGNPLFTGPTVYSTGPSDATAFPNACVGVTSAMAAVAVTVNTEPNTETLQPSINFQTDAFIGFFEWAPRADMVAAGVQASGAVEAVIIPVEDPSIEVAFQAGWIIRVMYFTFETPRATEVAWDPEFGTRVDYQLLASSNSNVLCPLFGVILCLLALFH